MAAVAVAAAAHAQAAPTALAAIVGFPLGERVLKLRAEPQQHHGRQHQLHKITRREQREKESDE